MSDSSMSSSNTSLSSSDSLDSFSNFDKLQQVTMNESTDGEVSSSTMQTKEAEKERKENLDWCLCGKCKAMSNNVESFCWREKNEVSDEILNGNFLLFWLYNMNFTHTEAGLQGSA